MPLKKNSTNTHHQPFTAADAKKLLTKLGRELPTAVTYQPVFNGHVYVLSPENSGQPNTPVAETYCLSIPSATELMVILADLEPEGFLDDPQVFASGSPFFYSQDVPWIKFHSNGAVRNAGTLAWNWKANSGDPGGKTAEANCRMDIAWG